MSGVNLDEIQTKRVRDWLIEQEGFVEGYGKKTLFPSEINWNIFSFLTKEDLERMTNVNEYLKKEVEKSGLQYRYIWPENTTELMKKNTLQDTPCEKSNDICPVTSRCPSTQ